MNLHEPLRDESDAFAKTCQFDGTGGGTGEVLRGLDASLRPGVYARVDDRVGSDGWENSL
jgi:hypothetical protein